MTISSANLRSRLWVIPVICVAVGVLLSLATMAIDRHFRFRLVPESITGGPDAAMGTLTTIAGSMVSLLGLVLTITMVVVQLAMGQFSPRIVQTFLQDRPSQLAIGLFTATFAHAMISLREVQTGPDGHVPGVAIVVAYVLVLLSIAMLVLYIDHIGRALRVSALIELVGEQTRKLLDKKLPDSLGPEAPNPAVVLAPKSGVIIGIDEPRLVRLASEAGVVIHAVEGLGNYVAAGAPLATIEGDPGRVDHDAIRACLRSGLERTLDEDTAYGLRLLVDMAERSLAGSSFLDPTTAVQCLDRIHDILRQIVTRAIPDGRYTDDAGALRLVVPTMTWHDYVHLAFDEVRLAGYDSPQVARRLRAALEDLLRIAPPDRQTPLREQLDLLTRQVRAENRQQEDLEESEVASARGLG